MPNAEWNRPLPERIAARIVQLAKRQCTDEEIVGSVSLTFDISTEEVKSMVDGMVDTLVAARDAGKADLRERMWKLAEGDATLGKMNATHLQGLTLVARAHLGYGEAHDTARLRELIAEGKRRAKAKRSKIHVAS